MAPPSPRRSSRARASNSQSQQTSAASSISSGRPDRNTRSANKTPSSKSTPSASLSSEPPEELDDPHLPRRRRRAYDDERDKLSKPESANMATDGDDIQEDDEAVRCICGFDDYPGPPPIDHNSMLAKEANDSIIFSGLEVSDDISGFYVQCDICKVWQHGACVGIMTEESSPDEYFCEMCRKDLHRIHKAINGQRYSKYLPLILPSRSSRSVSASKESARSPTSGTSKADRTSSASHASKRRSTMNSREAAYDEEEQLRRAIEASKELAGSQDEAPPPKRPKRGRSGSEENPTNVKRQRTSSRSASPPSEPKTEPQEDSDEVAATRNGLKKARSSRSQKEKTEREERERARQEAANKRKGRADRRRVEAQAAPASVPEKESSAPMDVDSDPSDEVPLAAARASSVGVKPVDIKPTVEPLPPAPPAPDTPPPEPVPPCSTHKKTARSVHKKAKGRNQYTRDRDDSERSPIRSVSRDTTRADETNGGHATRADRHNAKSSRSGAHSKTVNELKRRSAAFLDFIAKTQVELASEDLVDDKPSPDGPSQSGPNGMLTPRMNGGDSGAASKGADEHAVSPGTLAQTFKDMSCVEMMDFLTRDLVKWQNRYTA